MHPVVVSSGSAGAFEVSLAASEQSLYVGWYDTRDGNGEIYLRALRADGRRGREIRLTETSPDSYEVSLAALGNGVALAWYEKANDGRTDAQLAVWQGKDALAWETRLGRNGLPTRNPVVRQYDGRLFVAWIVMGGDGEEAVMAAWYAADGVPLGRPARLGTASATTWNLNAAVSAEGAVWVAWDAVADTRAAEIFIAHLSGDRVSLHRVTRDDGHSSSYPDVAVDQDRLALTWFDERDGNREVYLAVAETGSLPRIESHASRVTETAGASIGAYLAFGSNSLGLAWSDDSLGANDVYFQSFDRNGAALGEALALTRSRGESLIPAVVPWRDGFAVAWNELESASGRGVYHGDESRSDIRLLMNVGNDRSVHPDSTRIER